MVGEVNEMIKGPIRSPMTLPAILLLAFLLPLCPLPLCTGAFAYMDTERSVKLDAPFLPTPNYVFAEILSKAGVGKDDILYDLGSGDGRRRVLRRMAPAGSRRTKVSAAAGYFTA